ncbi:MAG: ribonuclease P protein component [Acidobacteriota bacterium]|nr:ribonuclease P protein component [Acidobacteriota bacterium]NLH70368.1 ribonuclease P protein component [Brooklawnia sp.]
MLSAPFRMRSSKQFDATVRDGVRAGRPTVVVHASRRLPFEPDSGQAQVGFVVSKKVGNAVVRNRVKRRLRHLASAHLTDTPVGVSVVVRALPAAAAADFDQLAEDLAQAWRLSVGRLQVAR